MTAGRLLPPSESSLLAELRKRVDRLERSTRVPQITRTGGVQMHATPGGFLVAPGAVTEQPIEVYASDPIPGPILTVTTTASGRVLLQYGARISHAEPGAATATLTPTATGPDGPVFLPQPRWLSSESVTGESMTTANLIDLPPNTEIVLEIRYSKDPGQPAGFLDPFLIAQVL